ncbi:MAG: DUF983 domain-containing protein [Planctomycetes bacterium]|nr:DUF983 domain-containing protein [Planctomycetota bacterium]
MESTLPISYSTAATRARKLVCPRCGKGRLFSGLIKMHRSCSECGLVYERAPGYFLGSAYVNYGIIALTMTVAYVGLHFGAEISDRWLVPLLLVYSTVIPIFLFRFARSWWLAMDCYFDPTSFALENDSFVLAQDPANAGHPRNSPNREPNGTQSPPSSADSAENSR